MSTISYDYDRIRQAGNMSSVSSIKSKQSQNRQFNKSSNNQIFDRLHNEDKVLKERRSQRIQENEITWKKQMFKPRLSEQAMKITRDPNAFHLRLHSPQRKKRNNTDIYSVTNNDFQTIQSGCALVRQYSDKSTIYSTTSNFNTLKKTLSTGNERRNPAKVKEEENIVNTLNANNFPFHPVISPKSKRLAESLGPSVDRILQHKKDYSKSPLKETIADYDLNSNKNRLSLPNDECIKICENIYYKGIAMNRVKEEDLRKLKEEEENKHLRFSFAPDLSKTQKSRNNLISGGLRKSNTEIIQDFCMRSDSWGTFRDQRVESIRKELAEKELSEMKFQPVLNKGIMSDDQAIIMQSIDSTNEYVNNRRAFIKLRQSEEQKKINQHCYCGDKKFQVSDRLITSKPVYNYNKMNTVTKSLSEIRSLSPDKVLDQRKEMGISDFFEVEAKINKFFHRKTKSSLINSYAERYIQKKKKC